MQSSRLTIGLILILVGPTLAVAQLRFNAPAVDLGELRGGPSYAQRFDFVNDSTQPIEIIDFRLGCGCLHPTLDKRVYQPGEKGTLLMNLRTLGQPNGVRSWNAGVRYRQADMLGEATLTLSAKIRNEVTVEPSILAMTVETTLRQEITITDLRTTPLKIATIAASSPAVRVGKPTTSGNVTKVIVEVSRTDLTATREDALLNIYTDDPHYRHLQVPITLVKAQQAAVVATPDNVAIHAAAQLVRLRSVGDIRVRIEKADADHAAIRLTWAVGPGDDATLKVSVDASKLTSSAAATVTVRFVEPAGATLSIPVTMRKE